MKEMVIVHDWLTKFAGAEKVLEEIYDLYEPPIYTLFCDRQSIYNTKLENADIKTSFLQKIPNIKKSYKNFFPFYPLAVNGFDTKDYKVIISSSHAVAKGIKKNKDQLHICYCHTPFRYVWDLYKDYKKELPEFKKMPFALTVKYMRHWDVENSKNVDYFIASSNFVAERIKRIYKTDSIVIYPPVDIEKFELNTQKEDYYIFIGRLANTYKKPNIVIESFNALGKKLIVIGDGEDRESLQKKAKGNIEFLGWQNQAVINKYLKRARALIFPSLDDFGIVCVEAQACGTPVIAFNKGGALETVIDKKTGIFFKEQTASSLTEAIEGFEQIENSFDPYDIRKNAERFSKKRFKREFKAFVTKKTIDFFGKNE